MRFYRFPGLSIAIGVGLAACSSDSPSPPQSSGGALHLEAYCNKEGLEPALRQTFIVIDERDLKPVKDGVGFAREDAAVRDAAAAFTSPASLENGRTAARERITLMIAPSSGASPRTIFTGCLPGLTAQERAGVRQNESKVSAFVSGGSLKALEAATGDFGTGVAGALLQAAISEKPDQNAGHENSLFSSLSSTGQIFRSTEVTPRVILVSGGMPASAAGDVVAARKAALNDAGKAPVDFGNAEVFVLGRGGDNNVSRAWLQTYLLRMNGRLMSWSDDASGMTPAPAPVVVKRFAGTARIPGAPEDVIQVRLAMDASGKLVNSWLIQTGRTYDRSIPLTGQGVCNDGGKCKLRSDNEGFAQVWVVERGESGGNVQFDGNAPFGGMRQWELDLEGENLKGKIFDNAVGKINGNGSGDVEIEAAIQQKANF